MASQFRMIDINGPQTVKIEWERQTPTDDSYSTPEGDHDGFWPSRDPDAAGYVLPENFDAEQAKAEERAEAFHAGEWEWIGIVAVAHVAIPIGGGSYAMHTFRSPGIWGVESDSGDYLDELYGEQKEELLGSLKTLGEALSSNTFEQAER